MKEQRMTQGKDRLSRSKRDPRELTTTAVIDDGSADAAEVIRQQAQELVATAIVEDISPDGVAMLVLEGETQAQEASSLLRFPSAAAASDALLGRTVLVLRNRRTQPVILGVVSQSVWDKRDADEIREAEAKLPVGQPVSVHADKRRVDLEATDEIRLTCGKSSLVMRRDGTVIVRGVTITTRATQANKIRGATVNIN
jgi:hypothetical protein